MSLIVIIFLNLSWSSTPKTASNTIKNTEIQWSICENSVDEILTKLNNKILSSTKRDLSYFDDPSLNLYKHGIQIRKRGTPGNYKLTAKTQYHSAQHIPWEWLGEKKFKCEQDLVGIKNILACSIDSIFVQNKFLNPDQIELISKHSPEVDLSLLQEFGPVENTIWELPSENGELTLDEVELPNNINIFAISVRTKIQNTFEVKKEIEKLLSAKKIKLCAEQKGKTIQILEAFSF